MKNYYGIILVFISGLLLSCGAASTATDTAKGSAQLDDLVASRAFEIRSSWARPMNTASMNAVANSGLLPAGSSVGQIDMIGNTNYLKVNGDEIEVFLPYFGDRQLSAGYQQDTAIEFNGVPDEFSIDKNKKGTGYEIKIRMSNNMESFRLNVQLYPSLKSIITVISSHRTPIKYEGEVMRLAEKHEAGK